MPTRRHPTPPPPLDHELSVPIPTTFPAALAQLHPELAPLIPHLALVGHPLTLGHPDPAAQRAMVLATTPPAPTAIAQFLGRMPCLQSVVAEAANTGTKPLANLSVFLVHHLSLEILGTIAALRQLGCTDIVTIFVGYNTTAEAVYRPDLDCLPDDEFSCYILASDGGAAAEPTYSIPRSFVKQPASESSTYLDLLDASMKSNKLDFMGAMRALIAHKSLVQLARCRKSGRKMMVIEDGGYTAPILNDAALAKLSVADYRTKYFAPADPTNDAGLPTAMADVVASCMLGSVEHTRNGYDHNYDVYAKYARLAVPAFSIAVSYVKTQVESDTVASSILNAVQSVLYSQGAVIRRRCGLVFGSRGNVGRRIIRDLRNSVDAPDLVISGCDLKVGLVDPNAIIPDWQFRPTQSAAGGSNEVTTYAGLDPQTRANLDLIIGITGGPTPGHPVLQQQDVEDWLLNGNTPELYLASGSSKTDEFPTILAWMNQVLAQATTDGQVVPATVQGHPVTVQKLPAVDSLSKRTYGSRYIFTIPQADGSTRVRSLLFVQDLMPANFLFYGVPTEIIDIVLAQLVSTAVVLQSRAATLPEVRLFAVDFDPEASQGVFRARFAGKRLPIPVPAQS